MENTQKIKEELVKKLQQCMSEVGLQPEINVSSCEAVVAARKEIQGKTLKVVAHISTRDVKPLNQGAVELEVAKDRLLSATVRPTLAAQTAARIPDAKLSDSDPVAPDQPC